MRNEQEPIKTTVDQPGGASVESHHPAFGTVSVVRTSGGATLFDSDFNHQYYITMRINTAYSDRHLSRNWIHSKRPLVEVSMSEAQWATMLSSIGQGDGTPCTIGSFNGEVMPQIIATDGEAQLHANEFKEHMAEVYARVDSLEKQVKEAKMTNKLKESLLRSVDSIRTAAGSNLRFVADSFADHMEAVVEKGKIELVSFAKNIGASEHPLLEDKKTDVLPSSKSGDI